MKSVCGNPVSTICMVFVEVFGSLLDPDALHLCEKIGFQFEIHFLALLVIEGSLKVVNCVAEPKG